MIPKFGTNFNHLNNFVFFPFYMANMLSSFHYFVALFNFEHIQSIWKRRNKIRCKLPNEQVPIFCFHIHVCSCISFYFKMQPIFFHYGTRQAQVYLHLNNSRAKRHICIARNYKFEQIKSQHNKIKFTKGFKIYIN